jgi:hypothetical protein
MPRAAPRGSCVRPGEARDGAVAFSLLAVARDALWDVGGGEAFFVELLPGGNLRRIPGWRVCRRLRGGGTILRSLAFATQETTMRSASWYRQRAVDCLEEAAKIFEDADQVAWLKTTAGRWLRIARGAETSAAERRLPPLLRSVPHNAPCETARLLAGLRHCHVYQVMALLPKNPDRLILSLTDQHP